MSTHVRSSKENLSRINTQIQIERQNEGDQMK